MEPRGRDQEGRSHVWIAAKAVVARYLGIMIESDDARAGSNRPRARRAVTARRGLESSSKCTRPDAGNSHILWTVLHSPRRGRTSFCHHILDRSELHRQDFRYLYSSAA